MFVNWFNRLLCLFLFLLVFFLQFLFEVVSEIVQLTKVSTVVLVLFLTTGYVFSIMVIMLFSQLGQQYWKILLFIILFSPIDHR